MHKAIFSLILLAGFFVVVSVGDSYSVYGQSQPPDESGICDLTESEAQCVEACFTDWNDIIQEQGWKVTDEVRCTINADCQGRCVCNGVQNCCCIDGGAGFGNWCGDPKACNNYLQCVGDYSREDQSQRVDNGEDSDMAILYVDEDGGGAWKDADDKYDPCDYDEKKCAETRITCFLDVGGDLECLDYYGVYYECECDKDYQRCTCTPRSDD